MAPIINRRDFLRGTGGIILSLPWFESMAKLAPAKMPKTRLAYFYVPIGVVRRSFFPGEAEAEVPEGNQGNKMASLFIPEIKQSKKLLSLRSLHGEISNLWFTMPSLVL